MPSLRELLSSSNSALQAQQLLAMLHRFAQVLFWLLPTGDVCSCPWQPVSTALRFADQSESGYSRVRRLWYGKAAARCLCTHVEPRSREPRKSRQTCGGALQLRDFGVHVFSLHLLRLPSVLAVKHRLPVTQGLVRHVTRG